MDYSEKIFSALILQDNLSNISNLTGEIYGYYYSEINETDLLVNEMNIFLNIRVILSWISSIIIVIGVSTNLVSMIAFLNPKTLSSTNVYLASLCACDCIALIGLLINSVLYSKFIFYEYLSGVKFIMFFYPYIYPLVATCQIASIYLTISVSFNQFFLSHCCLCI